MATPFSIQKLIFSCRQDFREIKQDIVSHKLRFCLAFEKELTLPKSQYAENVFDYIYNLFYVKAAFNDREHGLWVNDVLDADYTDIIGVQKFIDNAYQQILLKNRDHILKMLKMDHDDPNYSAHMFQKNIKENVQILLKGIF